MASDRDRILERRALFLSSALAAMGGCGPTQTGAERPQPPQPRDSGARVEPRPAKAPSVAQRRADASPPADAGLTQEADAGLDAYAPAVVRVCLSIIIPPRVEFAWGATKPTPSSLATLDAAASVLIERPELCLEVQGHADRSEPNAKSLSTRRAENVKRYLVRRGVGASRLRAVGFGATRPLSAKAAQNRRTEFRAGSDDECP